MRTGMRTFTRTDTLRPTDVLDKTRRGILAHAGHKVRRAGHVVIDMMVVVHPNFMCAIGEKTFNATKLHEASVRFGSGCCLQNHASAP